jgi:DNA (cytosine-5)-methyltransferase 1
MINDNNNSKRIVAVDLFCGVGGLTHGIIKSGIDVIAGLDIDESCKFAYERNNDAKFITSDIGNADSGEITNLYPEDSIKILMGCAPCQPFSTYSHRYNKDGHKDDKWKLINSFLNIINEVKPEIVSMENVPQLKNQKIFRTFVSDLKANGYFVNYSVVNCADYGVPQMRKRLVLLASKYDGLKLKEPELSVISYKTVKDTIHFLPKIESGESNKKDKLHRSSKLSEDNMLRIKQSIPGGTWHDWDVDLILPCHKKSTGKGYRAVYGRMEWDKPAPTVTTQFYGYGNGRFGHPDQDRALSMREGALLQSFPQDYKFIDGDNFENNRQLGIHIGNAVPVELGRAIGETILNHIRKIEKEGIDG